MFTERNQLKQQCTQAIRQWDTAIRERNDYKEQYTKVGDNFYFIVTFNTYAYYFSLFSIRFTFFAIH